MFRPAPMMRLRSVVLQRDERTVLREFGRLGAVQLTRTAAGADTAPLPPPDRTQEIARCDRLRSRVVALRRTLELDSGTDACPLPDLTFPKAEAQLAELERKTQELVCRREDVLSRSREWDGIGVQAAYLRGFNTPLQEFSRFEFLHFVTGSLPPGAWPRLEVGDGVVLMPLPARDGRQPLIAVTEKSHRGALDEALTHVGFQREQVPSAEAATGEGLWTRAQREQDELATEQRQLRQELESLAACSAQTLAGLEAWAEVERRLWEAGDSFPRTESTVLITGWIPEAAVQDVSLRLVERTRGRCVIEVLPPGDAREDDIPVLLRPPRLLRPFEMLVSAYGLPKYHDLAPTLFVAISFVLMFGMMFGDVGHGGVLALGGLVALLKSRVPRTRDFGILFVFNGLSSALFGVVYGSYFGIPSWHKYALWGDPLECNPMELMGLAIGIGVVLMSVGLLLNIRNRLWHRDWIDGVLGKFGVMGVVFYWGALALVTKTATIQAQGWWTLALVLFLGIPVVSWALQEPLKLLLRRRAGPTSEDGGMVAAITESVVGAFEGALLYLANTISFVRLAAYAMSHAALLMATFMLAAEVGRLSGGGPALSLLVIVLGNGVAILLEGIVASVQALRLEYYEFFGKFFSGEGKPFQPFCLAVPSA